RHAAILSVKAKHNDLDIGRFPQVATSFPCKVRKELLNKNNGDGSVATRKRKHHCQRSENLGLWEK
ncbi:unnamed protein product, partial [Hymenolepis diminuta]